MHSPTRLPVMAVLATFFAADLAASTACGPSYVAQQAVDPCQPATYNAAACQEAISQHGYYYRGVWHAFLYPYPFSYYSSGYNAFVVNGGTVNRPSSAYYSRSYTAPSGGGSSLDGPSGTVRGGFGGTGAARAASFGDGGFGG